MHTCALEHASARSVSQEAKGNFFDLSVATAAYLWTRQRPGSCLCTGVPESRQTACSTILLSWPQPTRGSIERRPAQGTTLRGVNPGEALRCELSRSQAGYGAALTLTGYTEPSLICCARYSACRNASAIIVRVGFAEDEVTNCPPSAMKRFLMS